MQQVNFNIGVSTCQSTSAKASKFTDSKQTDFAEMILENTKTAAADSSSDEKKSVTSQDSKASEKADDIVNADSKETKELPKDELSAEWLLQMQTMGLQVQQQESGSLEQLADALESSAEMQTQVLDALTQTGEQMPVAEQSTDAAWVQEEIPEILETMGASEVLEAEGQSEASADEGVAFMETLSEKTVISEEAQAEQKNAVADIQPEKVQELSGEEAQDTLDLETQTEKMSEVTARSVSEEDKDSKMNGEFHEELSLQQMQGQNLRMQNTFTEQTQETTAPLKTTEQNLPQDLGNKLAQSFPEQDGVLTIELEPASLGKLTIQVVYEEGRAAVSIFTSNPKTLELLSENAGEIAQILEDKTGQEVTIYTPETEQEWQEQPESQDRNSREQEPQDRKKQSEPDSFAQQLRLGLV